MYYRYRYRMTRRERFLSDVRYYIREYVPKVFGFIGECVLSFLFLTMMLVVLPIVGYMFM